jgi:hypothetical protein
MNILEKIFINSKIECPRCLGKGEVDFDDIKRLKKELKWLPGKCAYCKGIGKVNSRIFSKVSVDNSYLTIDIPEEEQNRILNNDYEATERAKLYENQIDNFIKEVEFLYFEANLNPHKIADFYFISESNISINVKKDMINYIEKIILHRNNID